MGWAVRGPENGVTDERSKPRSNAEVATDEALMVRLGQGQDWVLAELVRRHQHDLFRFCVHYVRETEVAKEMSQETFLRVYTARARFDPERKFKPWVLCIARNLCLNELKRKKAAPMETLEEYASTSREESGEILRFSGDGPDEASMVRERREALARILDTLDEESREILKLRFYEKMAAKEIADVIGSTEGAVRTKLHRILMALRDKHAAHRDEL